MGTIVFDDDFGRQLIYAKKIERHNKATVWVVIWRYHYCSDKRFVGARDETMRFLRKNFLEAGFGAAPDTARVSASIRAISPLTRSTHHIKIYFGTRELFRAVLDLSREGFNRSDDLAREIGEFLIWDLDQWNTAMIFSEESRHHIFLLIAAKWRH